MPNDGTPVVATRRCRISQGNVTGPSATSSAAARRSLRQMPRLPCRLHRRQRRRRPRSPRCRPSHPPPPRAALRTAHCAVPRFRNCNYHRIRAAVAAAARGAAAADAGAAPDGAQPPDRRARRHTQGPEAPLGPPAPTPACAGGWRPRPLRSSRPCEEELTTRGSKRGEKVIRGADATDESPGQIVLVSFARHAC